MKNYDPVVKRSVSAKFSCLAGIAGLAVVAAGFAAHAEPMSIQEQLLRSVQAEAFAETGDQENCLRQTALPWCAQAGAYRSPVVPPADEAALVRWAETVARQTWRLDPNNNPEHWESFADRALSNKTWNGDCDNMTFTVLDLLSRHGIPAERMYRVIQRGSDPRIFHMVGVVKLSDGQLVVVGDIKAKGSYAMPADFRIYSVNHASEGMIWRDAVSGSTPG